MPRYLAMAPQAKQSGCTRAILPVVPWRTPSPWRSATPISVPSDIDHVNAHGCSIPDYDICDTNAFKAAFGPHAYRIPITSIKSMIGHPLSAASALQTVAASMSIQTQTVPPTINQEVPDPLCDLDYVPNVSRVARIRHVLLNAHSSGGSVAALVVGQTQFHSVSPVSMPIETFGAALLSLTLIALASFVFLHNRHAATNRRFALSATCDCRLDYLHLVRLLRQRPKPYAPPRAE